MQTSDEVYIVHKFIPWCFIHDGERGTMKEQWEIAKSLCLLFPFFLPPARAQWFHIYRAKPDLASTSCTHAGQVLFLSVKEKLGITSVFLLFRRFGVSKLGWGGCRAGWEATSGSSVDFGDVRCCGLSFFFFLYPVSLPHSRLLAGVVKSCSCSYYHRHSGRGGPSFTRQNPYS